HPVDQLHREVRAARSADALIESLWRYWNWATANADVYLKSAKPKLDCGAGCAFCCHLRVGVRAHEAFAVAEHIQKTFDSGELERLLERLRFHVEKTSKMTLQEHFQTSVECPLLMNNQCSIYERRPFACRRYHSLDVRSC